jgi:hypothetical protein
MREKMTNADQISMVFPRSAMSSFRRATPSSVTIRALFRRSRSIAASSRRLMSDASEIATRKARKPEISM